MLPVSGPGIAVVSFAIVFLPAMTVFALRLRSQYWRSRVVGELAAQRSIGLESFAEFLPYGSQSIQNRLCWNLLQLQ